MNWDKLVRTCCVAPVCAAAFMTLACGRTESSPTAPSPATLDAGSSAPDGADTLSIAVIPNPVPWSSDAVDNCNLANRWRYEQILTNNANGALTITDRIDFFDGVEVKRSTVDIALAPGASRSITTQWCSANSVEHRAQTNFGAVDESGARVSFRGASVRLQRK
jgi:hypothetical protein